MHNRKNWTLGALTALLAMILLIAAGAAVGVAQDAYLVGDVTVAPAGGGTSACVGSNVTYSGSGMPAGLGVLVVMGMDSGGDSYATAVGDTIADGNGNWSLTAAVPATVVRQSDGADVATPTGTYDIVALSEDLMSTETGSLTVSDCTTTLPSTGFPVAAAGLLGAGLLTSAGIGIRMIRRGR